ncbi:hypothetical protein GCM10023080_057770 [Streptomyces pseudoechinosporeus]
MAHAAPRIARGHGSPVQLAMRLPAPVLGGLVYGLWAAAIGRDAGPITGWNVLPGVVSAVAFVAAYLGARLLGTHLPREPRAAAWAGFVGVAGVAVGFLHGLTGSSVLRSAAVAFAVAAGAFAVVFYRFYTTEDCPRGERWRPGRRGEPHPRHAERTEGTVMSTPDWFRELLEVSDVFAAKDRAYVADWRGDPEDEDDVPPFIFRLAALGRVLAERSAELTSEQTRQVFRILEEVMTSGSEYDSTAVATGFFEALLNAWDRGFDLRAVWDDVGPESRAYCLAWNKFGGVESPDWMR